MFNSLRFRLTIVFTLLAVGPLLIIGAIFGLQGSASQLDQATELQRGIAQREAREVQSYFDEIENNIGLLARDIRALEQLDKAQLISVVLDSINSAAYHNIYQDVAILDSQGREQVRVSGQDIIPSYQLVNRAGTPEYEQPAATGETYFGPPHFDPALGRYLMTVAVPYTALRGIQLQGVLVVDVSIEALAELFRESEDGIKGQSTFILDQQSNVIAHSDVGFELGTATFQLPTSAGVAIGSTGDDVVLAWDSHQFGDQTLFVVSEIPVAIALASTQSSVSFAIGATGVVLVVAVLLVGFIVRQIVLPIERLTKVVQTVREGDLNVRASINRADEIGHLAQDFNAMADQTQEFVTSLENRVAELQILADVNNRISTILQVDRLLQDVVDLTKERFRLYHAHIYLLDETRSILTLTVGAGHVGRQMVTEIRTIEMTNQQSIVASAAHSRRGVIINDVRSSPTFLPHPLLPDTASELAVPLIAHNELLGVLDVQSDVVGYFTQDVLAVMELMAGQIAAALSNASLYEQAERTSRYERAMGNIDRQIQGAVDMDEILQATVRELGKALRVSHTAIELRLGDGDHDQTVLVGDGEGNEQYE
ncbi:MAG: GAF domain-containing protein [Anaerolineaceae bacterium]|nr:GAF domain-containing protein [Anaerolineaceae bacterium]